MDVEVNGIKSRIILNIWDMAGGDQYRNQAKIHFQGAHAVVIVFAINNKFSFTEVEDFLGIIGETCRTEPIKVLVGNKKDLESERKVLNETAYDYALDEKSM